MAQKIRITKEFHFETGHALYGYDGLCKNVHGHSYKLAVTVVGSPIVDPSQTKNGMVLDFSDLKKNLYFSKQVNTYYKCCFILRFYSLQIFR